MAPALSAKERAEKAVSELDSYKDLLAAYTSEWKDLDAFIAEIDSSLSLKLEELQAKERAFEEKNLEATQALDRREAAIPIREESSLTRVQEQKDAAIAKFSDAGNPNPAPAAEKQDVMVVEPAVAAAAEDGDGDAEMKEEKTNPSEHEVRARPQIVSLCEYMDGEGLRKYIVDHRKEIVSLRSEVTVALQSAMDPSRLVLKALEGYHVLELDSNHAKETGASTNRRACILLMECLAEVLADPAIAGAGQPVVPPIIKEAAKEVAKLWRSKRDAALSSSSDGGNENSLDAQAFLQLLVTFGITSEFDDEELLKLVFAVCRRRQTPALCQALGLKHKMPGFLETLNKDGKQIEALCFAHHFEMMDKVQPGAMLKAYLKEARKAAQDMPKNVSNPKHESMMRELSAVKAVLRAVEEYNLADQFPTEGLHKRLAQLERSKADRRKPMMTGKSQMQSKKPRLSSGGQSGALPPHSGPADRGQYGGSNIAAYGMANQAAYDRRPQAAYSSVYGTDSRSPGSLSNSYLYSSDMISGSVYPSVASAAYSGLAGGYAGYPYGNGLVTQSSYQSSFLR